MCDRMDMEPIVHIDLANAWQSAHKELSCNRDLYHALIIPNGA